MSSSGLIYAVIVGAWAAYLVPMWLRRQDELNEARPTERFSTAIRLLSGKAGMERRYAKDAERRVRDDPGAPEDFEESVSVAAPGGDAEESVPDAAEHAVDVRAFADPKTMVRPSDPEAPTAILAHSAARSPSRAAPGPDTDGRTRAARAKAANRNRRAKLLARRRRTTMVLFLAFTCGAVVAAVGGLTFIWAPVIPAVLLSAYIVHLRRNELRRYAVDMDRRRGEEAASLLHRRRRAAAEAEDEQPAEGDGEDPRARPERPRRESRAAGRDSAGRRALVEQTDHAEWVDQQCRPEPSEGEGWDPVPVPLPTYVSAPVAPRRAGEVDLDSPDTWSSARSSTMGGRAQQPGAEAEPPAEPRRPRSRGGRTPLFDQYEEDDRPRAANE